MLAGHGDRLHLTLNDPGEQEYRNLPDAASVTRNATPLGFAENANNALRRLFSDHQRDIACVVNFDVDGRQETLLELTSALRGDARLAAVGAVLSGPDGAATFSVGTVPTPAKEYLRAAGLRSGRALRLQRSVLRRTARWAARNARPPSGVRVLEANEYLPWTCLAVRREAWESIGQLDERFPLYAEDIDWSLRCRQAGWGLAVADCGPVTHHERATRGPRADALFEYSHRELHRKWDWPANAAWQRRGLATRRCWPLRRIVPPLDWPLLASTDETRA
jgi:GT2 family glycosyltransferase